MELVAKIFETLGITGLALFQMALVIVLVLILSATLIRPILSTFKERDTLAVKPLEEARAALAEAEAKAKRYDESLRRAAAEALAAKRKAVEEASRAERRRIEGALEETNRQVEEIKGRIAAEKGAAARILHDEVRRLSVAIAEKVLGRQMA